MYYVCNILKYIKEKGIINGAIDQLVCIKNVGKIRLASCDSYEMLRCGLEDLWCTQSDAVSAGCFETSCCCILV